ncbi:MAG: phosphopantothenoylcysteine decarboxylase [Phycisphaerales bacterium]|nr:phosphopantothenoylcysteine decarboxylase [Phycisphaerales bacterium]
MTQHNAKPIRFLITAGPTREYIDSVRYLSNDSSGRMGFALAQAAVRAGHRVTLVHGPVALAAPRGARVVQVVSASEMLQACRAEWPRHDVLIKSAAVADYTPAEPSATKRKKTKGLWRLSLKPTSDILADLALSRRPNQVAIGFALEDQNERVNALNKLTRKRLDAIVLNRPAAIGADAAVLEILTAEKGWETWPAGKKSTLAARLIKLGVSLFADKHESSRIRESSGPQIMKYPAISRE